MLQQYVGLQACRVNSAAVLHISQLLLQIKGRQIVIIYYFDFSLLLKDYLKSCVVCILSVSGGWKSLSFYLCHSIFAVSHVAVGSCKPSQTCFWFQWFKFLEVFLFKNKRGRRVNSH